MKLSPKMKVALGAIEAGYVTYTVRPNELATFSHGIRRNTMQALADRGLIRMAATTIERGVVLPVPCCAPDPRSAQVCRLPAWHGGAWHEARMEPGYVGDHWPTDPDLLARYANGEAI